MTDFTVIDAIRKVDAVTDTHTQTHKHTQHARAHIRTHSSHVERTLFHLLCARKLPVLRDLWRGCPLLVLPYRILGVLLFIVVFVFELCLRRSFTVKHSPYARIAPVPTWRGLCAPSLYLRFSLSLYLSLSLSVRLSESVRPPADASHTARYARLSMRRAAHACPTTPVPTDAARGALTSPAATRKSERNTGSMKPRVPLYSVPPVDLGESSAMQDAARSPRYSRN